MFFNLFKRPPDFLIGPADSPYMRRWYVIPRNRWFNIYLHNILRSDADPYLHDHPWWNVSLILRGGYYEVEAGKLTWRKAGLVIFRRATAMHRLEVSRFHPSVWTLFITGRTVRDWGFACPQGWKSFIEYKTDGGCGERDVL